MNINFEKLSTKREVSNYKTGEIGMLQPLDDKCEIRAKDIERIAEICNSQKVFDWCFADVKAFKGRRYGKKDAEFFVYEKSRREWRERKAFVYVVRDPKGNIVCSVDIKSADVEGAEIGYWAAEDSPGWMTNAVQELIRIAQNAGYKKLFALVSAGNVASKRVLQRCSFMKTGFVVNNAIQDVKYELALGGDFDQEYKICRLKN